MLQIRPISQSREWSVNNSGDYLGDLVESFNLDLFSRKGKIRPSKTIAPQTTNQDITGLSPFYSFHRAAVWNGKTKESKLWGIADNKILKQENGDWVEATNNGLENVNFGEKSDLISVKSQGQDILLDDDDATITINEAQPKILQGFGPLDIDIIKIRIKNTGTTDPDLSFKIYERLQSTTNPESGGVTFRGLEYDTDEPTGELIDEITYTETIGSEFEDVEVLFDERVVNDTGFVVVIEPTSMDANTSFEVARSGVGDEYEDGMLSFYDGSSWATTPILTWSDDTSTTTASFGLEGATDPTGVNGDYTEDVDVNGKQSYTNGSYYIWWDGTDTWNISDTSGGGTIYFTRTDDNPRGDYVATNGTGSVTDYRDRKPYTIEMKEEGVLEEKFTMAIQIDPSSEADVWFLRPQVNGENIDCNITVYKEDGLDLTAIGTTEDVLVTSDDMFDGLDTTNTYHAQITISYLEELEHGDEVKLLWDAINDADSLPRDLSIRYFGNSSSNQEPYCYFNDIDKAEDLWMNIGAREVERLLLTTSIGISRLTEEGGKWENFWNDVLEKRRFDHKYPAVIRNLGAGGTLLVGNNNFVHSLLADSTAPSEAVENRLVFDPSFYVAWMGVTSSSVFMGLNHKDSETLPSRVIKYEPQAERVRQIEIPEGATVGFIREENCYIIDKRGQLRAYTGSSFKRVAVFPTYHRDEIMKELPHRNSIKTVGETTKIFWEGQYPYPAGVWILDENNLYHSQSITYDDTKSPGAREIGEAGALYYEYETYVGAKINNGSNDLLGVFKESNRTTGTFVTSKFMSQEELNNWQKVLPKGGTNKLKWRSEKYMKDGLSGSWNSSNEFTCTDADFIEAVENDIISVGYEVTIRSGSGAGFIAHITDIDLDTNTVTLDSDCEENSGDFTFSVENWKKFTNTIGRAKEWIQIKSELTEGELEELQVSFETSKTIRQ